MKVKNFLMGIAAMMATSQVALAIQSAGSGSWSVGSTWVGGVVPGAADDVLINNGHTVYIAVSTASANSLTVNPTGVLRIGNNGNAGKLSIDGGTTTSTVNGLLQLGDLTGTAVRGELVFTSVSQTLEGSGSITGVQSPSKVRTENGLTLSVGMDFHGIITFDSVTGTATLAPFANSSYQARFFADDNGTMAFASNLIIDDSTANSVYPLYKVNGGASSPSLAPVMQFNRACDASDANHPALVGDFEAINCGTMDFNASVYTYGNLLNQATGGTITTNGAGNPPEFIYLYTGIGQVTITGDVTVGSCP